jgi:hypothetical protein
MNTYSIDLSIKVRELATINKIEMSSHCHFTNGFSFGIKTFLLAISLFTCELDFVNARNEEF